MVDGLRYEINPVLSTRDFVKLLERSTLAERRPVGDDETMAGMVKNSNLIIATWD